MGYNGYVNLIFDGPNLQVDYLDLYDTLLLTETWSVDNKGRWLVRNSAASTRI